MNELDEFLEHYGVKGMKWGVRKERRLEKKENKKFNKKLSKEFWKVYNDAADAMNKGLQEQINNKKEYKDADFTKDSALRRKYYKDTAGVMTRELNRAAEARGVSSSKRGTFKAEFLIHSETMVPYIRVAKQDIKHADDDILYDVEFDASGFVKKISIAEDILSQSMITEDSLEHYGVKGMKWGIRRERGPDGRVRGSGKPTKSSDARRASKAAKKAKRSGISSLSNTELKALNERLQLERNYSSLTGNDTSAGAKFLKEAGKNILKTSVNTVGTTLVLNQARKRIPALSNKK